MKSTLLTLTFLTTFAFAAFAGTTTPSPAKSDKTPTACCGGCCKSSCCKAAAKDKKCCGDKCACACCAKKS